MLNRKKIAKVKMKLKAAKKKAGDAKRRFASARKARVAQCG